MRSLRRTSRTVTPIERGWSVGSDFKYFCLFRRNTLLQRRDGRIRVVLATLGNVCSQMYLDFLGHFREDPESVKLRNNNSEDTEILMRTDKEATYIPLEKDDIYYATYAWYALYNGKDYLPDIARPVELKGDVKIGCPDVNDLADSMHDRHIIELAQRMYDGEL